MTSRRRFLKSLGLVGTAALLPLPTFSKAFIEANATAFDPNGQFSLVEIKRLLSTYTMPPLNGFSLGQYALLYDLYNIYWNVDTVAGSFLLERSISGNRSHFTFLKNTKSNSMRHFLSGGVEASTDAYTTPYLWNCYSRIAADENDTGYLKTDMRYTGALAGSDLKIKRGTERTTNIGTANLSWKWGHINMAQIMSKEGLTSLSFSMLDELDMVLPEMTMTLFGKVDMPVGDKTITFSVFDLKGYGTLPWVTWVDDSHRAIFSLSCQEAYLLKESSSMSVGSCKTNSDNITLYPNPVRDRLFIDGFSADYVTVSITNAQGKLVANLRVSRNESINVSNLTRGIYVATIHNNGTPVVKKFVKE